jgi:hypothetical protein
MPTTHLLTPTVTVAHQARPGHASQDRHIILPGAVAVLDGATNPDEPPGRDGGWYADQLATALTTRLPGHGHDLADLLADAIADVTATNGLHPGASPSSTVTLLRWTTTDAQLEGLALADSMLLLRETTGTVHVLTDDRIDALTSDLRADYHAALFAGNGYDTAHNDRIRGIGARLTAGRNQPGGYYVAEADPNAAHHAPHLMLSARQIRDVALLTDGAASAIDDYGLHEDWAALLDNLRDHGPEQLLNRIRDTEATDPTGQRWPRPKPSDDATAIYLRFTD